MTEIISRAEAKARGLKRYFTGIPCKRRHCAERLVSSRQCLICACAKSLVYRLRNPQKVRSYWKKYRSSEKYIIKQSKNLISRRISNCRRTQLYRLRHRERLLAERRASYNAEKAREWRRKRNPEKENNRRRSWRAKNRNKVNEYAIKYYHENPEKHNNRRKRWYAYGPKNPKGARQWLSKAKAVSRALNRVAKKLHQGLPPSQSDLDILGLPTSPT